MEEVLELEELFLYGLRKYFGWQQSQLVVCLPRAG